MSAHVHEWSPGYSLDADLHVHAYRHCTKCPAYEEEPDIRERRRR